MILAAAAALIAINSPAQNTRRPGLDLGGEWQTPLGVCTLPGTTDQSRLGPGASDTTDTSKLTRLFPYTGKVSYERDIEIPGKLAGRTLLLTMERTKPSTLVIDGKPAGHFTHIYAPHKYIIQPLSKGTHHFEIVIDNTTDEVPSGLPNSHAYSENTQTNWNGILGIFRIEALPDPYIEDIQIYPCVEEHSATIKVKAIASKPCKARIKADVRSFNTDVRQRRRVRPQSIKLSEGEQTIELKADLGEEQLLWSEFHPALYNASVRLGKDRMDAHFGMKDLRVIDKRLTLNGKKIFLRGTHDALVFPLTGYPPMDEESWLEVFRIEKEYGLNHVRFHSCAPPKAAFDAADKMGIIMQAELPMWGAVNPSNTEVNEYMKREARMLLDLAGNSPSFGMLGLGNELTGDIPEMRRWLDEFRKLDPRHLYDFGSNNFLGYRGQQDGEDILVSCRTDGPDGNFKVLRSSFAFVDEPDGGPINADRPRTDRDFGAVTTTARLPLMGHETGQFQFFPDYSQIKNYTGVLYPYNLEIFRKRLAAAGLEDQAEEFAKASGAFSAECYKEDVEWFIRTPHMAGFQMLDLKDYPGQGTALVGILDALMNSKGAITPERWRGFCSPVVPMARFDDFCRRTSEPLTVDFIIANYSEDDWDKPFHWTITDNKGWTREGDASSTIPQGETASVAKLAISLEDISEASALKLTVSTGDCTNSYNLWAYPEAHPDRSGILVTDRLSPSVRAALAGGAKVLLMPPFKEIEGASTGGLFTPDYWNYSMFKRVSEANHKPVSHGTLGLLPEAGSALYSEFPTEGHSDWQWWSIAKNSRPVILDGLDGCRPVLQVIDNIERNHRLGILTEFKVGNGSLMLCSCDLEAVADTPEGAQFAAAIFDYMRSDAFKPSYEISADTIEALLSGKASDWKAASVDTAADYSVK